MKLYEEYKKSHFTLGLDRSDGYKSYIATPKTARIIGGTGVDGIHYCFIGKFGEMVFAVNPSNFGGENVYPIAETFEDFVALYVAVGTLDSLEQVHMWSREVFDAYVAENRPNESEAAEIRRIADEYELPEISDPYGYVKALQARFDYAEIPFKRDYYEHYQPKPTKPEWSMKLDGMFWDEGSRRKPGDELTIGKTFERCGLTYTIPSIAVCLGGIVVDMYAEIPTDEIIAFETKWNDAESTMTEDEREALSTENPLNLDFRATLTLNGNELTQSRMYCEYYLPDSCREVGTRPDERAEWLMEHYDLDRANAYAFRRMSFLTEQRSKPRGNTLALSLEANLRPYLADRFTVTDAGESVALTNPHDGRKYRLTVTEIGETSIDMSHHNDGYEHPTNCVTLEYTVTPEIERRKLQISDTSHGDSPRKIKTPPTTPNAADEDIFGIISGADGPTSVIVMPRVSKQNTISRSAAASSLYFEKPERITWRATFYAKPCEKIEIPLI